MVLDDDFIDPDQAGISGGEEEDFLDDDDSGDDYRQPSLASRPRLGTSNFPTRDKGKGQEGAAPSAKPGGKPSERAKSKSKSKDGYSWEATYKRSWDAVHEDESGSLAGAVRDLLDANKRKRILRDTAPIQRGIIRHLVLVLDLSEAMLEKDLRPNRHDLTLQYAREFVSEYFDQNPIGQLAVIGTRDGIAERIATMGGNTVDHISALSNKRKLEPRGEPSLQNALEMARTSLAHLPASNSREVLVVFGSLTTCDPGNIHDTILALVRDRVRVSMVSLAAEVKVCKEVCTRTGGTFGVAMHESHFKDLLFELVPPPAVSSSRIPGSTTGTSGTTSSTDLMQMGFPRRLPASAPATLCACHSRPRSSGYLCPRCGAKVCDVPTDCPVCSLTIVMSTHLARSYHHLFPVANYEALGWQDIAPTAQPACHACAHPFPSLPPNASLHPTNAMNPTQTTNSTNGSAPTTRAPAAPGAGPNEGASTGLAPSGRYGCTRCGNHFCLECDAFVHEDLHLCPGCC